MIIMKFWNKLFPPLDPEKLRARAVITTKIDLLASVSAAEHHEVEAEAYRLKADKLRRKILRLQDPNFYKVNSK